MVIGGAGGVTAADARGSGLFERRSDHHAEVHRHHGQQHQDRPQDVEPHQQHRHTGEVLHVPDHGLHHDGGHQESASTSQAGAGRALVGEIERCHRHRCQRQHGEGVDAGHR